MQMAKESQFFKARNQKIDLDEVVDPFSTLKLWQLKKLHDTWQLEMNKIHAKMRTWFSFLLPEYGGISSGSEYEKLSELLGAMNTLARKVENKKGVGAPDVAEFEETAYMLSDMIFGEAEKAFVSYENFMSSKYMQVAKHSLPAYLYHHLLTN